MRVRCSCSTAWKTSASPKPSPPAVTCRHFAFATSTSRHYLTQCSQPVATPSTHHQLILLGLIERPLDFIGRVRRYRMVAPQPPHHLRQDRSAHPLAMRVHAPRVIHVVALFRKGVL